jgi:hypothetical protein
MTDFIRSALVVGAVCLSVNLSALVAWGADAAPKQGSTAEQAMSAIKSSELLRRRTLNTRRYDRATNPK